jgi:putative oxidoreductase
MTRFLGRYEPYIYGVLRIVAGMMYTMHGTQKLFAWPVGVGQRVGETVPLLSLQGAAGIIETSGVLFVSLGFQVICTSFILS